MCVWVWGKQSESKDEKRGEKEKRFKGIGRKIRGERDRQTKVISEVCKYESKGRVEQFSQ